MANKYIKRCSTSYVIWEMQIKTIMKCHYSPFRMAKIQKADKTKCWKGCGTARTLIYFLWECKMIRPLWKRVWQFLSKVERILIILSSNPLLIYLSNRNENLCPHKTCTHMFMPALLKIKNWKQPKCPLAEKYINKLWNIHDKYHSTIKKQMADS